MFETLKEQPVDGIMMVGKMYRADPRDTKVDLGVGVYKDASGLTPIMRAVKAAEQQLWEQQDTKVYTGLIGDPAFGDAMINLVLAGAVPRETVAAAATPGGTGAVRQAFELIKMARPDAILEYLDIEMVPYRYFDSDTRGVDFDGMLADLKTARKGDVVLLHGCCHNPTGANLNATEWDAVIAVLQDTGAVPMIDIAYQGFGDGLEADGAATRKVAAAVAECLIAASCSKNFGIYRERTGILMMVADNTAAQSVNQGTLSFLNRQNYSFPPDHGARLVTMILNDDALRADWMAELEEVRTSMLGLRTDLAAELQRLSGSDRFGFLAQHRGMFSRLGTSPEKVTELREKHGIYMVSDSRMNIAGLNADTIPLLAKAIIDVGV